MIKLYDLVAVYQLKKCGFLTITQEDKSTGRATKFIADRSIGRVTKIIGDAVWVNFENGDDDYVDVIKPYYVDVIKPYHVKQLRKIRESKA
jgi:hypothetical protein